jgi:hypothetical protein
MLYRAERNKPAFCYAFSRDQKPPQEVYRLKMDLNLCGFGLCLP